MPIDGDVRAGKARWAKYPSPPIGGFPVQIRGDGNPSITQLALNVEVGAPGHQIVSRMRTPKRYGCSVTAVVRSAHIPVDRSELLEQRLIVKYHTGDKGVLATAQIPWCRTGVDPDSVTQGQTQSLQFLLNCCQRPRSEMRRCAKRSRYEVSYSSCAISYQVPPVAREIECLS